MLLRLPQICKQPRLARYPKPEVAAAMAGNEVGITCAHSSALRLFPAHLCAGSTCGNTKVPWWWGYVNMAGGQGVAGSNPAVPTGS